MIADPNEPMLSQVIGYLGVEAVDGSLPEWRRSRAAVLVAYLEKLRTGLQVEHATGHRLMGGFCPTCQLSPQS